MANQGLKNAREQEKRNRERYEEMYGEDEYNNLMSKKHHRIKKIHLHRQVLRQLLLQKKLK